MSPSPLDQAVGQIRQLVGERLSDSMPVREQHARGESWHAARAPDAVVYAETAAEVARIAAICNDQRVPLIPFGTGTSLEGHVTAVQGGITLNVSRMNKIIEVSADDQDCTIEPGVTRLQLNDHIRSQGLFFPIDPGADASLGGMASTRASGTNAVRYGTMRENVLALDVVLADGTMLRTGTRARKSAAGYDLTRLFVGAEGTLGIITKLSLRLQGIPETIVAAVCSFETLRGAVDTVMETIQMGIPIARVELLDDVQMDAVNRYSKLNCPVTSTLFFEFHGTPLAVDEHLTRVKEIAAGNDGGEFQWASTTESRNALWKARHTAYYAALALRPGSKGWSTDVCVPISRLTECIVDTKADIEATGLLAPIVGHVGDGNFHLAHVVDADDKALMQRTYAFNERLVRRALAMGGTCTGEHGVGSGKMAFLEIEAGDGAITAMRRLKDAFDPRNIMNPGKVLRAPGATIASQPA